MQVARCFPARSAIATGTLNHLLWADRMWLGRFMGPPCEVPAFGADMFPDFEELRSERDITVRPDIRPLEGHQKINVCGPGADALDAQQRRMRIFIVQAREAIEMTPGKSLRDLNAVVRFLSRQAK